MYEVVVVGGWAGTCTNDGCVPTRVLAHAARLVRDTRQFADYDTTSWAGSWR